MDKSNYIIDDFYNLPNLTNLVDCRNHQYYLPDLTNKKIKSVIGLLKRRRVN